MLGMIDVAAPAQLFSLAQKVVVISGASSGLGARWAPVVAAAGGTVVLSARREPELAQVAAAIPGSLVVPADLTLAQDRQRLVETTLRRFGRIDVLVNNAAAAASAPARGTSLEEFREMIDTGLTSLFALTQLAGAAMIDAGRGSIINVASLAAERSVDRYPLAAYSAAKAGVVALTRSLAAEWGQHGIRVNAIARRFSRPASQDFSATQSRWHGYRATRRWAGPRGSTSSMEPSCSWPATRRATSPVSTCSSTADGPSIEMARPDTAGPLPAAGSPTRPEQQAGHEVSTDDVEECCGSDGDNDARGGWWRRGRRRRPRRCSRRPGVHGSRLRLGVREGRSGGQGFGRRQWMSR
jgi:NAD(P)-dependent dehydrogenase (short-subunit alcohol dehydrogenase family)